MIEFIVRGPGPIFFVDDDELYQMIMRRVYEWSKLPNEFICFSSGTACIAALLSMLEKGERIPSLVLLDVNMPVVNGIETVERIRSRKEFAEVPIITMLSSSNDDSDIAAALGAGASSYCEKPMDIRSLQFVAVPEEVD
ncbi:MAG: response regulator [Geminicoccaceae bacterium]